MQAFTLREIDCMLFIVRPYTAHPEWKAIYTKVNYLRALTVQVNNHHHAAKTLLTLSSTKCTGEHFRDKRGEHCVYCFPE